ncbi:hypothetical protein SDC9_186830 [bioreactor metagenome]|uniref:Uncharacterized protein n=1 Tax=bioreactor metagenome TaxID=1076179 RepID=A0A645HLI9_9ZZZZ
MPLAHYGCHIPEAAAVLYLCDMGRRERLVWVPSYDIAYACSGRYGPGRGHPEALADGQPAFDAYIESSSRSQGCHGSGRYWSVAVCAVQGYGDPGVPSFLHRNIRSESSLYACADGT